MSRSSRLESGFQDKVVKRIKEIYPDSMVFKMDQRQGIPDILILKDDHWASLETKRATDASKRPNQEYYVDKMNKMSFSRFICPENKEEVLHELQQTFES